MRLTLYDKNETIFQSRGIGILTDAVSATVHEEINGVYDLTVVYPYGGKLSSEITPERLIKANTPRGEQMFRVASIQKTMDEMTIRANHLFYDLADFFIEDTFVRNAPSEMAIQQVLQKTALPNPFSATSELSRSVSTRLVRKNVVEALLGDEENSLISRAGGELDRNNYNITWRSRLGSDRGVKIKYRKNLLGLDFTEDYTTVITRLMPEGFDGIFLPEKYVDSPRIGQYQQPKYGVIYYESIASKTKSPDQDGAIDHEQAMQALREAAQKEFDAGVDLPTITCEVNFIDLSQTEEYKDYVDLQRIYIGDTLRVSHHPIGVELSQRLIAYDWDALRDRYDYLQLGSPTNAFFGVVQSATIASQSALEIAKSINQSVFDKARAAATELIKQGYGGYVRIYPDKILVMDTDDEATARRVWQYNLNGQGYSTHGVNGPYTYAWTMDGAFNTSFIAANSITANQLAPDVGQNLNIAGNVAFTGVLKKEDLPDLKGEPGQPGKDGADGAPGKDGVDGKDGRGIADVLVEYATSSSQTEAPKDGWSTTIPQVELGTVVWERTKTTYSDGTETLTTPQALTSEQVIAALQKALEHADKATARLQNEIALAGYADQAYVDGVLDDREKKQMEALQAQLAALDEQIRGYTDKELSDRIAAFESTLQDLQKYLWYDSEHGVLVLGVKGRYDAMRMTSEGIKFYGGGDDTPKANVDREKMEIQHTKTHRLDFVNQAVGGNLIYQFITRKVDGVDHLTVVYAGGGE